VKATFTVYKTERKHTRGDFEGQHVFI